VALFGIDTGWSSLYDFSEGVAKWIIGILSWIVGGLGDNLPWVFGDFLHWSDGIIRSDLHLALVAITVESVVLLLIATANLLTFIWIERKLLARMMDRRGPMYVGALGYLQQIADGLKLFLKEYIVPEKADRLGFDAAPVVLSAAAFFIIGVVPIAPGLGLTYQGSYASATVLLAFAAFAVPPFAVLIAGWSANNKYTLIGGMRAAALMMSYEIPMLLAVASVVVLAGGFDFVTIVEAQQASIWFAAPLFIGFVVFLICIVAELERIPFDLPEAEAELVEGWTTEYSGMRFGMIMAIDYLRGYIGCLLATLLFLGGWDGPAILPDWGWTLLKAYFLWVVFVWMRASLPRVRTDQILHIGWKRLLPLAMLNLLVAVVLVSLGWV